MGQNIEHLSLLKISCKNKKREVSSLFRKGKTEMINCVMFRHGETDWNVQNKIQGITNIPLNNNGIKQAYTLAKRLKSFNFDEFYSSDMDRAIQTAKIIMQELNYDTKNLFLSVHLREVNYGIVEGMDRNEMRKKYKHLFCDIIDNINHPFCNDTAFPEGETKREAFKRLVSLLTKIDKNKNKIKNIALSSHGNLLSFIPLFTLSKKVSFQNCDFLQFTFCAEKGIFSNIRLI